ncbi:MAG: hypothetical protein IPI69_00580 [Bacteroidales bacterium]|jgi:hypothetical protein|nr:hypothetical protein [Bacteroidales bacterium]
MKQKIFLLAHSETGNKDSANITIIIALCLPGLKAVFLIFVSAEPNQADPEYEQAPFTNRNYPVNFGTVVRSGQQIPGTSECKQTEYDGQG